MNRLNNKTAGHLEVWRLGGISTGVTLHFSGPISDISQHMCSLVLAKKKKILMLGQVCLAFGARITVQMEAGDAVMQLPPRVPGDGVDTTCLSESTLRSTE